jgi:hypothetical protein
MIAVPDPAQSKSFEGLLPVKSLVETVNIDPADVKSDTFTSGRPSLRKRVPLALALITFSMGVAATVAWQADGHAAREMIASSFPQLRWLAPAAQNAPETIALVAPATPPPPSADQRQLSAISLDLDAVRQSLNRLAGSQEAMTRNVDKLVAGQAQLSGEIAKLLAITQYNLHANSEPLLPQASAPVATPRSSQRRTTAAPAPLR